MKKLLTFLVIGLILLGAVLSGFWNLDFKDKVLGTSEVRYEETTGHALQAKGPVENLDLGRYYASKYDISKGIYCGADPQLNRLSQTYLRAFDTVEEAEYEFPGWKLAKPCSELAK